MVLTSTTTDQAYETMYDDDELLGNQQTMPWFDPNYLASNNETVSLLHHNMFMQASPEQLNLAINLMCLLGRRFALIMYTRHLRLIKYVR